jgi:hypothetical protein
MALAKPIRLKVLRADVQTIDGSSITEIDGYTFRCAAGYKIAPQVAADVLHALRR